MDKTLGERIVAHRKRLGLTQDKLAELLGVTAQAVSKWENNQSCPDITTLPKLAELFHTTTDELLGVDTKPETEPEEAEVDAESLNNKQNTAFCWGRQKTDALTMAVFVLLVGTLTLLSRIYSRNVSFWDILWPSAILIFSLRGFYDRFSFFSVGGMLAGCYFLLVNLNVLQFKFSGSLIFPIMILTFGVALLFDALKKPDQRKWPLRRDVRTENNFSTEGEAFTCSLAFGENTRFVTMPKLSHGEINCSFGSFVVDLNGCGDFSENCKLDAKCSFGELKLLIPKHIRVEPNASTAFGDLDIKGQPDAAYSNTIQLDAKVSFGEITIEYT